jgi:hypothetical protein
MKTGSELTGVEYLSSHLKSRVEGGQVKMSETLLWQLIDIAKEREKEQKGYSEEDVRLAYFQGEKDSYIKGGQTKEMEDEFIQSLKQKKLNKSEKGCACYGSNSIHKCNCN